MSTQLPPEGISQSAWDEAMKLASAVSIHGSDTDRIATLARAIMAAAEREREEASVRAGHYLMVRTPLDVERIVECEEAIRNPANSNFATVPHMGPVA